MKARMAKLTGLLLAAALVIAAAYTNQAEGKPAASSEGNVRAGVSLEFDKELNASIDPGTSVASGVTGTVSGYLNSAVTAVPEITDTDIEKTAKGQAKEEESEEDKASEEAGLFGYRNLGIAQTDSNLNVREAPGTDASLVGRLPRHAGCEILSQEGDWTKITSGKVTGYVSSEYLLTGKAAIQLAKEIQQTIATVTTDVLRVRQEPNTDSSVITTMPKGEELEVVETLDGWVKVNVDSDVGYISADYVDIAMQLAKAQTMQEARYGQGVSDVRVDLVKYATQFVGNPYVWGGTSLTRGADCSGFVLSVFAKYGVSLPHSSGAQSNSGTRISASEARPGDLFFYGNGSRINHVAIYIGGGQVVHASSPKSGIKISGSNYRNPVKVVRILKD